MPCPKYKIDDGLRNIALKIAYQGQGFVGWQCQPLGRTAEGELRKALSKLHKRRTWNGMVLYAAGRTDSGVHATGQVANFYSDISPGNLPDHKFREAVNSHLPKDIRILQSWEVPCDFHARYSARIRIYHYRIIQGRVCGPEQRQNAWYVRTPQLDIAVLNCMVSPLIGEHDFSAFAIAGDQAKTKVRRLYAASFYCEGPYIVFCIAGNAFLWRMVRCIVGTVVGLYGQYSKRLEKILVASICPHDGFDTLYEELYTQRYTLREQMLLRLAGKGHSSCNAPAQGLTLSQVVYPVSEAGSVFGQYKLDGK